MTNPTNNTPIAVPAVQVPGGDLAGAVLELLQALDEFSNVMDGAARARFDTYDDWMDARRASAKRLAAARARFTILHATVPSNTDAHEVTA